MHVATEHFRWSQLKLKCAVGMKYTLDFKDFTIGKKQNIFIFFLTHCMLKLYFLYVRLIKYEN